MTNGFARIRIGHAGAHHGKRAASASCTTGGFYSSPTPGQTVATTSPLNITWDATCLASEAVDIYLYAPSAQQSLVHIWETVANAPGNYQTPIKPKWWNSTASQTLQITIIESGSLPSMRSLPAGPVFTATYSAPSSGPTPADADTTHPDAGISVVNNLHPSHGLSKGKIAAAVIVPLLFIALLVAAYLKINRARSKEQRKRFSQAVDRRMSTISTDWKAMSAAGANAAVRSSMARSSVFSLGGSTLVAEGGRAGIGAGGLYTHENAQVNGGTSPQMSQLRPGARPSPLGDRVSRVSFAVDPRPSLGSRKSVTSRAYPAVVVPPLPELEKLDEISPTQTSGPLTLTPEDIRARLSGQESSSRPSVDEVLPALSMMRTGGNEHDTADGDLLITPQTPSLPTPTYASPLSPVASAMPMQLVGMMSPDEMLRLYATRNNLPSAPLSMGGVAYPAVSYNGNGMRTLYSPASPNTPSSATPLIMDPHNRKSVAATEGSRYSLYGDTDDAYIGTAN